MSRSSQCSTTGVTGIHCSVCGVWCIKDPLLLNEKRIAFEVVADGFLLLSGPSPYGYCRITVNIMC